MNRRSFFSYCAAVVGALGAKLTGQKKPKLERIKDAAAAIRVEPCTDHFILQTRPGCTIIGEYAARRMVELNEEPFDWIWVQPANPDLDDMPFEEWRVFDRMRELLENPETRNDFADAFTKPVRTRYVDYDAVAREIMASSAGR